MDEALQQPLIFLDRSQLSDHTLIELDRIARSEVVQLAVLQPAPKELDGVEHRRIRWQPLQAEPIGEVVDQLADRVAFVHGTAVPDDDDPPSQFLEQRLEERCRIPVIEVAIDQRPREQTQAVTPRRDPQSRRDGDLLARAALLDQDRRLAARRPSAANQRGHQQAAFVDQGEGCPLSSSFFF
jgi:hypothetical protein